MHGNKINDNSFDPTLQQIKNCADENKLNILVTRNIK